MSEIKTKITDADVSEFIKNIADTDKKKNDSFELLKIIAETTGFEPKMWGASIIGFGQYHYKSERSKQEGDWPLVGFSPRKAAISLYVYCGGAKQTDIISQLGKFKMGKGCIYIKKLADIDRDVLKKLIISTITLLQNKHSN